MDAFGGFEERRQEADAREDFERAGLDRGRAGLAVWVQVPLDEPRRNSVAGKFRGCE
jgi:hypothetical protein